MFVRSSLVLTGLTLFLATSSALAQTSMVKVPNSFGADVRVKNVQVECKGWTCELPELNVFKAKDTLELEFTNVSGEDELVSVLIETENAQVIRLEHTLVAAKPAEQSAFNPGFYVSPVWPNPAKDYLAFNLHGATNHRVTAYVYDLLGKELFKQEISQEGQVRLELPSIAEGRYYFMLRDGVETLTMQEIQIGS